MSAFSKRRAFESGHHRKFMVIIDDTPEFRTALYFAARVASRTGGRLTMLHVTEQPKMSSWMPVQMPQMPSRNELTADVVKDLKAWLKDKDLGDLKIEAISRSGDKAEQIVDAIDQDEDVAVLVLGASESAEGPGPVVSALTHGNRAGDFPVPIYLVPGNLSYDEIDALA